MSKLGHGDHWLAALPADDPRLQDALAVPVDAPAGLALHRAPLTESLDMVQVTRQRRLVTAYPEPRATALLEGAPRELQLWETRAEGWLTIQNPAAGALTLFLTDLAEGAPRYAAAGTRSGLTLEVGAIAYQLDRAAAPLPVAGRAAPPGPPRLRPAREVDERFLPDDYAFEAEVVAVHPAGAGEVLDLEFQNGLALPVAWRERSGAEPGARVRGVLWLTGRLPEIATGPSSKAL